MKNWTSKLILPLIAAFALGACGQDDGSSVSPRSMESKDAETFRSALVSEDDIAMDFEVSANALGLAGEPATTAGLTVDAITGTNTFMYHHLAIMRFVTSLPPSYVGPNRAIWEGKDDEGDFFRVKVERSETPRGVRFDYNVLGGTAEDGGLQLLPIVDGHVVRIDTRPAQLGKQGFGIVRFHFSNYNTIKPEEGVSGTARVAFRRIARVRQVHVRMLDVSSPDDPDFPPAAEYKYTQLPDGAGAMAWFSKSDISKDGAPLENVAVHTVWRNDYSGVGHATAFGGSLEVDYWTIGECWDSNLIKGYEKIEMPTMTHESGDPVSCLNLPTTLHIPEHQAELPDEDQIGRASCRERV